VTLIAPAIIRPDDWNLALFVHILGATVVVGSLVLAISYLVGAWRGGSPGSLRLGFRSLLYGAIPGYIVMRAGAEWIYSKEAIGDLPEEPDWTGIGYAVADIGLLLLLIATITSGIAARRTAAAGAEGDRPGGIGVRLSAALVGVVLVGYVIALWAMTTKPA
jgi:hypothetical protein